MSKGTLLKGAIILSIAGVITKVISAIYRVPYQNMAGDIGFYVYQQVYPFYGMAIIFATIGFPVVISKFVAEYRVKNKEKLQEFLALSFISLQIAGLVIFLIFYLGAPVIASFMQDNQLVLPIRAISFIFLFVPFVAVVRGYYQGLGDMKPTAMTQIIEQVIRITVILTFTYIFVKNGFGDYVVGTGAAFGSIIGVFFAGVLLFLISREDISYRAFLMHIKKVNGYTTVIKKIYMHGFAICLSAMALILFQAIDAFTMVPLLKTIGINVEEAKIMKGVYDRGQPLIQLGTVIATSIALPLIPMLATVFAQKKWEELRSKAELALRTSLLFGLAAVAGLAIIIEPVNIMLFTDGKGTDVLLILSFSILFSSITSTTSAVLQGVGYIGLTARHVTYGIILKIILSLALIPIYATKGAALATVIGFSFIALLNVIAMLRKVGGCIPSLKKILLMLLATIFLIVACSSWQFLISDFLHLHMNTRLGAAFIALSTAVLGVAVYLGTIIFVGVYSEEELKALPIAKKIPILKRER
ncbi:putative polysaccharide biosynthesis protein [Lottiidibacillus patelloidae]|nr:polysaccharide biosynthesis protein [Lottiidibacillus patelloidae]